MLLTSNIMRCARWKGYPFHVKQDMTSEALYRCTRACERADPSMGPQKVFSYFIRTIWLAFKRAVDRYYKDIEEKDTYMRGLLRG